MAVLELIAQRTRKPIGYFLLPAARKPTAAEALADEFSRVAARVQRFVGAHRLPRKEAAAMRSVERSLRQGAIIARGIDHGKR
jgi:hypothetical protein